MIQLNKETFSMERSAFYTATGGFDTHATVDISDLMTNLNDGLEAFTNEMKVRCAFLCGRGSCTRGC